MEFVILTFLRPLMPYEYSHKAPSFVTSGHPDTQDWASECPDVKNYKWRLNSVWHKMLYSCTHMATVGVKGLCPVSSPMPYNN